MGTIKNPILPGFHPDPSIIRVGDDYYLATSTFEWFPGVGIYHSKDLQNWELINRALTKVSQLDMKGNDASGGVFAPCLSYDGKMFYLIYTNVRTHWYEFMDCHNYLVTTPDIYGEWSEPVYLHSAGFDPSMFHDDDGRKWVSSIMRHYRDGRIQRIMLQEYDPGKKCLTGEMKEIWGGSGISVPEGPHIYKKDGYYYLLTAEGGTEYGHAETVARARNVDGPYEGAPDNPLLTARNRLDLPLQKAGHADLVSTENGEWYLVHLTGRPLPPYRRCILGRETAIQKVTWKNDWPYVVNGPEPSEEIEVSWEVEHRKPEKKEYVFTQETVLPEFHSLRIPLKEAASLTARPGWLRLVGKDSPNSRFEQTLLMRRQEDFCFSFETAMEFSPISERQMAGILYFYDECDFYYLRITTDTEGKRIIDCMIMDHGKASYQGTQRLSGNGLVYLKVRVKNTEGSFSFSYDRKVWYNVGGVWDASKISDEYPEEGAYTGAMVGIGCHDMLYRSAKADFAFMEYCPEEV